MADSAGEIRFIFYLSMFAFHDPIAPDTVWLAPLLRWATSGGADFGGAFRYCAVAKSFEGTQFNVAY